MGSIVNDDIDDDQFMTEDDRLVKRINDDIKESEEHLNEWLKEARTAYDYFAGDQWDEEDKAKLTSENRPIIVFNRIARTINAVAGLELQNRQEVRFTARQETGEDNDDAGLAETLTAAAKWVRDNCDAEDEESEAFQDTLICGMGWTNTSVNYETNLNGYIPIDRIDPLMMRYDPNAKKRNLDDRRWNALLVDMDRAEFKALWPDFDPQFSTSHTAQGNEPHDATHAFEYINNQSDQTSKRKTVRVVQYQYWEREIVYRVAEPDGLKEYTQSEFKEIKKLIETAGLKYIKQPRKVFKQAFKNGTQILEKGPCPVDGFTFRAITGLRNRNKNTWFGLVSLMKDPQMWANKWLSQILHILNTNSKGGILYETGAFKNPRDIQNEWAKPNSAIECNPSALSGGKIQPRVPAPYPDGIDRLMQNAMQNINDIPGVNLEMLGIANRDQANSLELQRKEAGVTILATFFDSLRRYRKEQGRILAEFIKKYITDGRMIRIVGEKGARYVPLVKDQFTFEYDIVTDDSPTSPHQKEKVFAVVSSLLPTLLQSGIPIPPDILDYAPIPEGLKEKWKAMLGDKTKQQKAEQLETMNMQMMQIEAAKKEKEVAETESRTILNVAKAQQAAAIGQDEAAQAANKLGLAHAEQASKNEKIARELEMKNQQMISSEQRKNIEFQLDQQRKEEAAANSMRHKEILLQQRQANKGGNV